uniref:Uncharacterized protein n=1 Tax=Panagrolaimus sp. PS1159 TaxID=55785 RepID=A0AC35FA64_9BILA
MNNSNQQNQQVPPQNYQQAPKSYTPSQQYEQQFSSQYYQQQKVPQPYQPQVAPQSYNQQQVSTAYQQPQVASQNYQQQQQVPNPYQPPQQQNYQPQMPLQNYQQQQPQVPNHYQPAQSFQPQIPTPVHQAQQVPNHYQPSQPQLPAQTQNYRRYIDLLTERNLWGFGIDDNYVQLPSSVCNSGLQNNNSIFRSSVSAIPETPELVKKCRLPMGLTLHPFRDQRNLHILQTTIVRCRYCRTYINPYVYLSDSRHWRCNICYRSNDLPDDFCFDPETNCYTDPMNRPELKQNTVEFIATKDYMLRPPQPACYFFVLDVSKPAIDNGYLHLYAEQLQICLDQIPGGDQTLIAFMCVDSGIHYFQFLDGEPRPRHLTIPDCDDPFVPAESGLLINLKSNREAVISFLQNLPSYFDHTAPDSNCLGAALQIAFSVISEIGGRITVMQSRIPDVGVGALKNRETGDKKTQNFGPATDFYKRLALESTGKQVSYDLFVMASSPVDLATLAEMSKVSGGTVYHFPNFHYLHNTPQAKRFEKFFNRYLTRKIGFEAVLRIRCSRGVSLHSFYGNFFVRSTDLLALPTVNPDSAIGVQIQVDESLSGQQAVCFQAALLYTSSRGDRRIRVHTMCLPIISDFGSLYERFDVNCSVSLLAKMAADRAQSGGELSDCREGLINAVVDAVGSYNRSVGNQASVINAPIFGHLKFFSLFVLGMLKHKAFQSGSSRSVSCDEQYSLMLLFKNAPTEVILLEICPALYAVHEPLSENELPQRLPLTYGRVNENGIYLLDTGNYVYLYVRSYASPETIENIFGVKSFTQIDQDLTVQQLANPISEGLFWLLRHLQKQRAGYFAPVVTIRDDSPQNTLFTSRLIEDRTESAHSYIEFLHHIRREMTR